MASPAEFALAAELRLLFPALDQEVHGRPLVYLDNAASAQKPRVVLEAMRQIYERDYANVHRGVHTLSQRATTAYEGVRGKVQRFLNARSDNEIVYTRGTTEAINLVANSFVAARLKAGDEILLTWMEHHSNIVPWQLLAEKTGAQIRVVPVDDHGELDLDAFERLLGPRTRFAALSHVSNAIGTINPVKELVARAHAHDVPVLLDGAQAAPHLQIDVQALDCDFYTFSSHKIFGPTGAGVLYGKAELLEAMPPWQGGGDMIRSVSFTGTTFAPPPHRFEAGTPAIAEVVGMGAALDFLETLDHREVAAHEQDLLAYATKRLSDLPGLRLIGTAREKVALLSFVVEGVHAHDVGTILDHEGIAVRVGHHCAQPLIERFNVAATVRASFAPYNTRAEIDALVAGLEKVREIFAVEPVH
jgi:cysteine desulfurase / selenocysteine lyase